MQAVHKMFDTRERLSELFTAQERGIENFVFRNELTGDDIGCYCA